MIDEPGAPVLPLRDPLARDNTASLCSLCQGKRRRDRAPDVPLEFWRTEAMAAALDSGDLGQVVRA